MVLKMDEIEMDTFCCGEFKTKPRKKFLYFPTIGQRFKINLKNSIKIYSDIFRNK